MRFGRWILRIPLIAEFFIVYLWEMMKANIQVSRAAFSPKVKLTPAILRIPLDLKSDNQILLLASLVTMTPGSITVDVSNDRKSLFAHLLFYSTPEAATLEIKNVLEGRIQRIWS